MPEKTSPKENLSRKERFLVSFKKYGLKTKALEDSRVSWHTLKGWLTDDAAFATSFQEVLDEVQATWRDELEEEGLRRALARESKLLMFFLKRFDPAYREKVGIEHGGSVVFKENLDLGAL